ncbi:pre-rRNA processing and 40S ribosomal subunit assembly [Komagataella phaffii CBS 7435]|nr:pre-rRNA processing and 40S ribosomal subunit assembly [Komagataella phaffii CBS 7435]CCA39973.1 pre-rRNA processing and 40S ribosomal subunit assembly [Komagataella phaffii CBS 7435]
MSDSEKLDALEIQRRNFEAQFGSLEDMGYIDKTKVRKSSKKNKEHNDSEDDSGSGNDSSNDSESDSEEFNGFSENEEKGEDDYDENDTQLKGQPKTVKFTENFNTFKGPSKDELKMARAGKPISLKELKEKQRLALKNATANNSEEQEHLVNDLQLQRLLDESHLLAGSSERFSGADLLDTIDFEDPIGKARLRTLNARVRKLASINGKNGGLPARLEKMPMSMRKGMIKKQLEREAEFEKEAKEAGIVLSKKRKGEFRNLATGDRVTNKSDRIGTGIKKATKMRDRGLKINSVGRSTRNGLVITPKEIAKVSGPSNKRKKR